MFKRVVVTFLIGGLVSLYAMSLSALNSADKSDLMQIKGIGEVKAAAILKERKKSKFKSFDDLSARVKGIGKKAVSNIKNDVKVKKQPKTGTGKKSSGKKSTTKSSSKKASVKKPTKTTGSSKTTSKKEKAKKATKTLKKKKSSSSKSKKSTKSKKAA